MIAGRRTQMYFIGHSNNRSNNNLGMLDAGARLCRMRRNRPSQWSLMSVASYIKRFAKYAEGNCYSSKPDGEILLVAGPARTSCAKPIRGRNCVAHNKIYDCIRGDDMEFNSIESAKGRTLCVDVDHVGHFSY